MIEMFDSVDVNQFPRRPQAVAGYVDGHWQTFALLRARFPHSNHLSITVFGGVAACLDVEPGDARPEQAGAWVRAMLHRHHWRPCVYAALSNMPAVQRSLARAGLKRWEYRLWVAHYDGVREIPGGYDAKQYTDRSMGRNLDASVCRDDFFFFNGHRHPQAAPPKRRRVPRLRCRLVTL